MLEVVLKNAEDKYRTKMVIIDGVYSQDGDIAYCSFFWPCFRLWFCSEKQENI